MSKSRKAGQKDFLFEEWIRGEYLRSGGFTALIVLVAIRDLEVVPLRSTFMHVIGDEIDWLGFNELMRAAEVQWDGVFFLPIRADEGGPVEDTKSRFELRELDKRIIEDRMVINEGHFFDKWGRRLKIEEATAQ